MAGRYEQHSFYCLNCGHKGIPLMRNPGHKREKFHRKVLYCPFCKQEVNHIEITTMAQEIEFKENFAKGVYKDEAEKSLRYVRSSWSR